MYHQNFPDVMVHTARLEDLDKDKLKCTVGRIDILLSSPECQSHSKARGNLPRNESSQHTAFQTIDYASTFKPRWIVIENVQQIRNWAEWGGLKSQLKRLGYHLQELVLNSADYGTPQTRRRLFLAADRERSAQVPSLPPVSYR